MVKWISFLLSLVVFFSTDSFSLPAQSGQDNNITLRLGTASRGGPYYSLGLAIKNIIEDSLNSSSIQIDVIPTQGSKENIQLLESGDLDFAIVQNDIAFYAEHGREPFRDTKFKNLRGMICLHREPIYIITNLQDTSNPRQLINKRVNVGLQQSGLNADARIILRTLGIEQDIIKTYEAPDRILQMLKNDAISMAFLNSISDSIKANLEQKNLFFFPLTTAEIDNLIKTYPCFTEYKEPLNDIPVSTVAVNAILVTHKDIPERSIYLITQLLDQNYNKLVKFKNKTDQIDAMSLKKWHIGSEKLFREQYLLSGQFGRKILFFILVLVIVFHIAIYSYYSFFSNSYYPIGNKRRNSSIHLSFKRYTQWLLKRKKLFIALLTVGSLIFLTYVIHSDELRWSVSHNQTSKFGAKGLFDKFIWVFNFCGSGFNDNVYPKSGFARLAITTIRLFGLSTILGFAGIIGYKEIKSMIQAEKGERVKKLKNHIVVCGFNKNVPNLLDYLTDEQITDRRDVLLLAPLGSEFPLRDYNLKKRKVRYINGSAMNRVDLERAFINTADIAVIVADEDSSDSDANNIFKILTIEKFCRELEDSGKRKHKKNIYTIAEIERPENFQIAKDACIDEIVNLGCIKPKIFANAILTPGVSGFIEEVFTFNSLNDLYPITIDKSSELINKSFDEILYLLRKFDILLLSIRVDKSNKNDPIFENPKFKDMIVDYKPIVITNPSDELKNYKVKIDDVLIVLARDGKAVKYAEKHLG